LYFIVLSSQGQNLIKNGDFEEYTKCPKGLINEAEEKPKVLELFKKGLKINESKYLSTEDLIEMEKDFYKIEEKT